MDKNNNQKNNPNRKKNIKSALILLVICLGITALFTSVMNRYKNGEQKQIDYNEFLDMLDEGEVKKVEIGDKKLYITPKKQENPLLKTTYYTFITEDGNNLTVRLRAAKVKFCRQDSGSNTALSLIVSYVVPFILIYAMMWFLMRGIGKGGGMMGSVGKSNAKVYVEKKTGVTFADVAGQDEAKESLTEMVDFLHNPGKYIEIGARLPKGALLVGPPGTGKTLLAKAVAGEANVPFFSLSGSDFVEMFVGVGASRVRDLFKQAQSMAPCIIFIDEIDAIGKSRDSRYGGGNDEREQTLNALLAEMDGFDSSKGLVILAATNRPEVLDKALLRPGRFDRRVIVERPDLKGRVETLKVHAKNVRMDETVDFDEIALATSGAVGSDLANMINEAALAAVKAGRQAVSQKDLFEAVEVVIAGKEKKDRILGEEEKKIVAYHEVGHAMAIAVQKHTEPVQKITIVPRTMGALGYTMQVPEEERYLMSKEQMLQELVTLFGGRAAEEVIFHSVTTGAANDIERATQIARAMVTQYGMSETFGLMGLESIENRYLDGRAVMNCSDATGALVDAEVKNILKDAYEKAKKIIEEHREVMDEIAAFLIEKETITGKEFMEIYNKSLHSEEAVFEEPDTSEKSPSEETFPSEGSLATADETAELPAASQEEIKNV
ncbi:MAG: ATP-dependent zinc metalloprotease FtsH [Eubacterium sp.]|nr:ATP-dependent zinc metalloprotease FtsH [Eubacterium sp.]MDD7208667.1 ATP-dependent zinc metalloprotease FtsH [Lachnospiraceae bacterium]MDY5497109.1 ATP-dependent zinc metalloprotease FtsH [Anaerobutyricum sp.]